MIRVITGILLFIGFLPSVLGGELKIRSIDSKNVRTEKWKIDRTKVFKVDSSGKIIRVLPPLPVSRQNAAAVEAWDQLWVIGGRDENNKISDSLYSIALKAEKPAWQINQPLPQGARENAAAAYSFNEIVIAGGKDENGNLTKDVWGFSPRPREGHTTRGYEKRTNAPWTLNGDIAPLATGQSHLLFVNGKKLALFHDVTDTWIMLPELPEAIESGRWEKIDSSTWRLDNGQKACAINFDESENRLPLLDYIVIVLYFLAMIAVGIIFAKRQKVADDFALGGQRVKWWASAMSIMASGTSAVSFMAIPAFIACTTVVNFAGMGLLIATALCCAYITYPLYRKLNITSTFEYLENRYGVFLRLVGSALAILAQLFARMSVVILIPALAISSLTGISVEWCVILLGVVTTLYSSFGGFEAVVYADVIQGVMMLGGLFLIAIIALINIPGGIPQIWETSMNADKLNLAIMSFDPALPNFWFVLLGTIIAQMSFASDQIMAQRIRCVPEKDIKKLAFMTWGTIGLNSLLVIIVAVLLFVFFKFNPEILSPVMQNDEMIPVFILKKIPQGITGMVIAALFAASMSTISTSVNTCAVLFCEDFVRRFKKDLNDTQELFVMQGMSIFSGLFGTCMAYYLISSKTPFLSQLNVELGAMLGGGFAGVFALGMFTRRAHEAGAIMGILISASIPVLLKLYAGTAIHWSAWGLGFAELSVVCFLDILQV